jgi:hypothetical protein
MNPDQNILKEINRWLKVRGNTKTLLAARLGYYSSATIDHWFNKKKIPHWQVNNINKIIKEKRNEH